MDLVQWFVFRSRDEDHRISSCGDDLRGSILKLTVTYREAVVFHVDEHQQELLELQRREQLCRRRHCAKKLERAC